MSSMLLNHHANAVKFYSVCRLFIVQMPSVVPIRYSVESVVPIRYSVECHEYMNAKRIDSEYDDIVRIVIVKS
jgi:hypothetical protein